MITLSVVTPLPPEVELILGVIGIAEISSISLAFSFLSSAIETMLETSFVFDFVVEILSYSEAVDDSFANLSSDVSLSETI